MGRGSATVTWKIWIWTVCNGCLMPSVDVYKRQEEDEMRYEEDEVFPDDLFYSFYYYSWQAVKAYQDVLEQVPAEFAQPAAAVRELL